MKHSLDRKMDRILERENSGRIKKGIRNRALRKLFANRLSVLGFIIFIVILVMCLGAPLFTQYSATKVDLRNILSPPTSSPVSYTHLPRVCADKMKPVEGIRLIGVSNVREAIGIM